MKLLKMLNGCVISGLLHGRGRGKVKVAGSKQVVSEIIYSIMNVLYMIEYYTSDIYNLNNNIDIGL